MLKHFNPSANPATIKGLAALLLAIKQYRQPSSAVLVPAQAFAICLLADAIGLDPYFLLMHKINGEGDSEYAGCAAEIMGCVIDLHGQEADERLMEGHPPESEFIFTRIPYDGSNIDLTTSILQERLDDHQISLNNQMAANIFRDLLAGLDIEPSN